jgi:hypothetical protein
MVRRSPGASIRAKTARSGPIRVEAQPGFAPALVEAGISECYAVLADLRPVLGAAARPPFAPHLEQVGEIRGEAQFQLQRQGTGGVAPHREALEADAVAEELRPAEMQLVAFEPRPPPVAGDVRVGQVAGQHRAVIGHPRTEQQRFRPGEPEFQARQVAGVAVV